MTKNNKIKLIVSGILAALTIISFWIAKSSEFVTEYIFSRIIFKIFSVPIAFVTGVFPFSVAEIGIAVFFVSVAVSIIVFTVKLIRRVTDILRSAKGEKGHRTLEVVKYIFGGVLNAAVTVSVIAFLFFILCGVNYYRYDFEEFAGFEVREYTVDELYEVCVYLAHETSNARKGIEKTDKNGITLLEGNFYETSAKASECMKELSKEYKSVNYITGRAKPIIVSRFFSYMDTTGIYSPFTIEANVNADMPEYNIPVTMCHELAHLSGYMKEDEANYIAYLACINSEYAEFRYSGYALAFTYASNRLYDADYDKYKEVVELLTDEVIIDFNNDYEYWAKLDESEIGEAVGDVSGEINDAYLNVNGQEEGTKSYGMMVDLLIADYLSRDKKQSTKSY